MPALMSRLCLAAALMLPLASRAATPAADHHQHLFSPGIIAFLAPKPGPDALREIPVEELVGLLDKAGIGRAAIMSVAYMYGRPTRVVEDEYAKVQGENDWTAAQAAKYPGRLRAFCGFNPLKDYALKELERCAFHPGLRHGIKMHFGNSDVQLENPEHVKRLQEVFRAANRHRMAIAVHLRANIGLKRPYGEAQARAFLTRLMPQAPDILVQVAHFAGTGPGFDDPPANEVMRVFAEAAARKDPNTRNLYFDVASIATPELSPEHAREMVTRIRMVGVDKILYGSDAATPGNMKPVEAWAAFRALPLSPEEFGRIAGKVAPYLQ
ncbi:amidohydrolase family protein [Massilia agri]|uniref:Amidohydrolase family protein n=1 Tax=Massilia agri TaxID=1886785 RepID=A0ABT2AU55_9BURK|nr:amidohydrolase family protein [Massilia agri]MCS0599460.1 amidohydrolase family protein [Massilia agri]